MARYTTTVDVAAPPEAVFDFLADFTTVAEWDPGVVSAEALTTGDLGVGSAFRVTVKFGPRSLPLRYEITAFDRPRRVVLEAKDRLFRSHDTIMVIASPSGSSVTYDALVTLNGPLRILDPLLARGFQGVGDRAAAGLQRRLGLLAAAAPGQS